MKRRRQVTAQQVVTEVNRAIHTMQLWFNQQIASDRILRARIKHLEAELEEVIVQYRYKK